MAFQIAHGITVQVITHGGVTHTIKLHIRIVGFSKFLIRLLHAHGVQRIDILAADLPFRAIGILHRCGNRPQHTACGGDTHLGQFAAQILFQQTFHLRNGGAHFTDVMNLPVQHGTGLMLFFPLGYDMKPGAVLIPHCAHDTSGADIQSEYQFSTLYCRHV